MIFFFSYVSYLMWLFDNTELPHRRCKGAWKGRAAEADMHWNMKISKLTLNGLLTPTKCIFMDDVTCISFFGRDQSNI